MKMSTVMFSPMFKCPVILLTRYVCLQTREVTSASATPKALQKAFQSLTVWEKKLFMNVCASNGCLKCHRVLISTTPYFGDKVIS